MKLLNNKLKNELKIRTQKDYPIKGVEFIDITPLTMQKEVMEEIIQKFLEETKNKKIDYIVSPEARGFLFGTALANRLKVGFIPVRKKGKLPPTTVETEIDYQKEYGKDILELPKLVEESYQNKNFYIIDDIYATGNTVKAIQKGIQNLGGNIVGTGVIINIVDLNQDKNIFSLLEVQEET